MKEYYKYNILPIDRFKNNTNSNLYYSRFQNLAKKSFYYFNDRLYYIKENNSKKNEDGKFENIDNVIFKKIPFIFEIFPFIEKIHNIYGHIQPQKLSKIILKENFYMQGLDIIINKFCEKCPECNVNYFSKNISYYFSIFKYKLIYKN